MIAGLRIGADRARRTLKTRRFSLDSVCSKRYSGSESGISPEFSRVLRAQILMKDRRWFVVVPKSGRILPAPLAETNPLFMVPAQEVMSYPIVFEGTDQSALREVEFDDSATP